MKTKNTNKKQGFLKLIKISKGKSPLIISVGVLCVLGLITNVSYGFSNEPSPNSEPSTIIFPSHVPLLPPGILPSPTTAPPPIKLPPLPTRPVVKLTTTTTTTAPVPTTTTTTTTTAPPPTTTTTTTTTTAPQFEIPELDVDELLRGLRPLFPGQPATTTTTTTTTTTIPTTTTTTPTTQPNTQPTQPPTTTPTTQPTTTPTTQPLPTPNTGTSNEIINTLNQTLASAIAGCIVGGALTAALARLYGVAPTITAAQQACIDGIISAGITTPATEQLNASPLQQALASCVVSSFMSANSTRAIIPAHLRLFGTSLGLVTNCVAGIDSNALGNEIPNVLVPN